MTSIDDDAIIAVLSYDQSGADNPTYRKNWSTPKIPIPISRDNCLAIVAHHRWDAQDLNDQYFIICDRRRLTTHGVLFVNLDFCGFEDAVRINIQLAGTVASILGSARMNWQDIVTMSMDTWPQDKFAVYVTSKNKNDSKALLRTLNAGLEGRRALRAGHNVCRDATTLLPENGRTDPAGIVKLHQRIALEEELDPMRLILVDRADWDSAGVRIIQMSGHHFDMCTKPAEYAAEILTWLHQELYSWQEGRQWSK